MITIVGMMYDDADNDDCHDDMNDKGDEDDEATQGVLLLGRPHLRPCLCLHCDQQGELFSSYHQDA